MTTNTETYVIQDFRPGIFGVPGISHPPGAATEEHTWGCKAAESGALIPGPRLTREITVEANEINTTLEAVNSFGKIFVNGILAQGPVFSPTNNVGRGKDLSRTELVVGFEWGHDLGSPDYELRRRAHRYKRNEITPFWEVIANQDDATVRSGFPFPSRFVSYSTRQNPGTPGEIGQPGVAMLFERGTPTFFPDPATPTLNTTLDVVSSGEPADGGDINRPPQEMIAHQNRLVIFPLNPIANGVDQLWASIEGFYFTEVNDFTTRDPIQGFFDNVVYVEHPSGWADFASLTADELLLIKRKGGAVVLRGALDDFVAKQLPNFKSPGFAQNKGTVSPIGYVYCVENGGVWVWQGGQSTVNLAKNQRPDFWRPQSSDFYEVAPSGCSTWDSYIVVPNNFYFDVDHQGWWKLHPNYQDGLRGEQDAVPFWFQDQDHNDRWLYCTPRDISSTPGSTSTAAYEFDKCYGASYFTWQSHPVAPSLERKVDLRQIVVSASGTGTVKISARTSEEAWVVAKEFGVNSEFPTSHTVDLKVQGSHLQIRIESEGALTGQADSQDDDAAPTIYKLEAKYHDAQRNGKARG